MKSSENYFVFLQSSNIKIYLKTLHEYIKGLENII